MSVQASRWGHSQHTGLGGKPRPTRGSERAFGDKGTPCPPSALQDGSEQNWPSCEHVSELLRLAKLMESPWAAARAPTEPLLGLWVSVLVRVSAQGQRATQAACARHVQLSQHQPYQAPVNGPSTVPLTSSFGKAVQGLLSALSCPLRPGNRSWTLALLAPTLCICGRDTAHRDNPVARSY